MPLLEYKGSKPKIDEKAWVSPNATLIGDITVGADSVIWPGVYLRSENAPIKIGQYNTIFDGVMMFASREKSPIDIGNYNIIETGACILGTFLTDYITIGENVLIQDHTSIGEGAVIISSSVITTGMIIAERAIMKGDPASIIREQSRNDLLKQKERAEHFSEMFIRMRLRLPNLQPYALTESAIMRELLQVYKTTEK